MWQPLKGRPDDKTWGCVASSESAVHYICNDDLHPSSQSNNTNMSEKPLDLSSLLASKLPVTVVLIQQIGFGASIIASWPNRSLSFFEVQKFTAAQFFHLFQCIGERMDRKPLGNITDL